MHDTTHPTAPGMSYSTATKIVRTGRDRLETRACAGTRLMSAVFVVVGVGLMIPAILGHLFFLPSSGPLLVMIFSGCFRFSLGIMGLIFAVIGLVLSRLGGRRIAVAMRSAEDECLHDASVLAEFMGVPVRHMRQTVVPDPRAVGGSRGKDGQK